MKQVSVVAAVIEKDGRIFATQRGYGEFKDGWEFPGGKIEEGETPREALAREIFEELDCRIEVGEHLITVECDYALFHLSMACYRAKICDDSHIMLKEHEAARWLDMSELDSVDWLPADIEVVRALKDAR